MEFLGDACGSLPSQRGVFATVDAMEDVLSMQFLIYWLGLLKPCSSESGLIEIILIENLQTGEPSKLVNPSTSLGRASRSAVIGVGINRSWACVGGLDITVVGCVKLIGTVEIFREARRGEAHVKLCLVFFRQF